jgi:hypothetical protein
MFMRLSATEAEARNRDMGQKELRIMTGKTRMLFVQAPLIAALFLAACVVFGAGRAGAKVVYLSDGALLDPANGQWDLPLQGSCPADATKTTRPDCVALRFPAYTTAPTCATGSGGIPAQRSWATSACNDLDPAHQTQSSCEAVPGRVWSAGPPGVCAVSMVDESRNIATCVSLGGTWLTYTSPAGTCVGSWVMPSRNAYTPALLSGSAPPAAGSPGDQCLRCHNETTQYNSTFIRLVGEHYLKMGHKNMARKVNYCSIPGNTTAGACTTATGTWIRGPQDGPDGLPYPSDDSGNVINWNATPNSTITVSGVDRALYWVYGDWLSPLPRTIYSTDPVAGKPGLSYSCARCHTTGWTSDATLQSTKEPEKSFPGITWDGVSAAVTGQVNFASGVTGDTNKMASWDQFGIMCSRCHISVIDDEIGSCALAAANCNSGQAVCEGPTNGSTGPQGCGGRWDSGSSTCLKTDLSGPLSYPVRINATSATCSAFAPAGTFTAPTGGTPTAAGYSAPLGMGTHNGGDTAAEAGNGYCSNFQFTQQYQCTSNGYQWLTACSITTPDVCTYGATTQTDCTTATGTWVTVPGFCSNNPGYNNQTDCTNNGFTWQTGWCTSADTYSTCGGGSGISAKTWRVNGTQQSCQVGGGAFSLTSCSIPSICSAPIPGKTFATATKADCDALSPPGTWTSISTSEYTCISAGGKYTGNKSQRGPIITSLCVGCHRQETGGIPYANTGSSGGGASYATTVNPGTYIKVGPYHNTVSFPSHPHGNMFLNSPHGQFVGTWGQIPTGTFKFDGTGLYKSFFQRDGEAANTGNSCTGCHNPHKSTVATVGEEGEFVEECPDCHQKNLAKILHPKGTGTPLGDLSDPAEACETCHMPGGVHMFRINADASYSTFPPAALTQVTNANTAPDGGFTSAVWVDLDMACGQCHGGGTANAATNGSIIGDMSSCTASGGTWDAGTAQCTLTDAEACAANSGTWDGSTCTLNYTTQMACLGGGGMWTPVGLGICTLDMNASCVDAGGVYASGTCTLSPSAVCTAVGGTFSVGPPAACTLAAASSSTCAAAGGTWSSTALTCTLDLKKVLQVADATSFAVGQRVTISNAATYGGQPTDFPTYLALAAGGNRFILAGPAAMTVTAAPVVLNPTANGAGYMTKVELATKAKGIHNDAPAVNFSYTLGSPNTLIVNVYALATCSGPCDAYDWDWGDGTAHGSGPTASHTYASAGPKSITLTVEQFGVGAGSKTKIVSVFTPDIGPTVGGTACNSILNNGYCTGLVPATCTGAGGVFDNSGNCSGAAITPAVCTGAGGTFVNAWYATLVDNSTDDNGITLVTVVWGDGSLLATGGQGSTFAHQYIGPSSYLVRQTALDGSGQQSVRTCPLIVKYLSVSGTVKNSSTVSYAGGTCTVTCSNQVACENPAGGNPPGCGGVWNSGSSTCTVPSYSFASATDCTNVSGATITVRDSTTGIVVKTTKSAGTGSYTAGSLKPGTYTVVATAFGYVFPDPWASYPPLPPMSTITVGPSVTGNTITAITP